MIRPPWSGPRTIPYRRALERVPARRNGCTVVRTTKGTTGCRGSHSRTATPRDSKAGLCSAAGDPRPVTRRTVVDYHPGSAKPRSRVKKQALPPADVYNDLQCRLPRRGLDGLGQQTTNTNSRVVGRLTRARCSDGQQGHEATCAPYSGHVSIRRWSKQRTTSRGQLPDAL